MANKGGTTPVKQEANPFKKDNRSTPNQGQGNKDDKRNSGNFNNHRDRSNNNRKDNQNQKQNDDNKQDQTQSGEKKFTGRCRLFVGNLTPDVTEDDFKKMFEPYGETSEAYVNQGRGFGFIRLDYRHNAEAAKAALDGLQRKGRYLRVRFATHGAALKVKHLHQYVSNELLEQSFSQFGDLERCVVIVDDKGKTTGEGIVEFVRKPGANSALRRIREGVFLLGSDPKPILVEPLEQRDEEDGMPEKFLTKTEQYKKEREKEPRFAPPGTFEYEFGMRWKQLEELEKQRIEQVKKDTDEARIKLEDEMQNALYEYQAEQIRQDLIRQQEELRRLEELRNADRLKRQQELDMRRQQDDRERLQVEERRRADMMMSMRQQEIARGGRGGPMDSAAMRQREEMMMAERFGDRMGDRMPDRMPDRMGDRMPDSRMPERMPDRMGDRMPDGRMGDRLPDRMQDRMGGQGAGFMWDEKARGEGPMRGEQGRGGPMGRDMRGAGAPPLQPPPVPPSAMERGGPPNPPAAGPGNAPGAKSSPKPLMQANPGFNQGGAPGPNNPPPGGPGSDMEVEGPPPGGGLEDEAEDHGGGLEDEAEDHGGGLEDEAEDHGGGLEDDAEDHGGGLEDDAEDHGGGLEDNTGDHGDGLEDDAEDHGGGLEDDTEDHGVGLEDDGIGGLEDEESPVPQPVSSSASVCMKNPLETESSSYTDSRTEGNPEKKEKIVSEDLWKADTDYREPLKLSTRNNVSHYTPSAHDFESKDVDHRSSPSNLVAPTRCHSEERVQYYSDKPSTGSRAKSLDHIQLSEHHSSLGSGSKYIHKEDLINAKSSIELENTNLQKDNLLDRPMDNETDERQIENKSIEETELYQLAEKAEGPIGPVSEEYLTSTVAQMTDGHLKIVEVEDNAESCRKSIQTYLSHDESPMEQYESHRVDVDVGQEKSESVEVYQSSCSSCSGLCQKCSQTTCPPDQQYNPSLEQYESNDKSAVKMSEDYSTYRTSSCSCQAPSKDYEYPQCSHSVSNEECKSELVQRRRQSSYKQDSCDEVEDMDGVEALDDEDRTESMNSVYQSYEEGPYPPSTVSLQSVYESSLTGPWSTTATMSSVVSPSTVNSLPISSISNIQVPCSLNQENQVDSQGTIARAPSDSSNDGAMRTGDQNFKTVCSRQSALGPFLHPARSTCLAASVYGGSSIYQGMSVRPPLMASSSVHIAQHPGGGATILRRQAMSTGAHHQATVVQQQLMSAAGQTMLLQQRTMTVGQSNVAQQTLVQQRVATCPRLAQQTVVTQRMAAAAPQNVAQVIRANAMRQQAMIQQTAAVRLAQARVMGAPMLQSQKLCTTPVSLSGAGLVRGQSMMQHLVRQRYLGGPVMPGRGGVQLVTGRPVRVKMTYTRESMSMESNT